MNASAAPRLHPRSSPRSSPHEHHQRVQKEPASLDQPTRRVAERPACGSDPVQPTAPPLSLHGVAFGEGVWSCKTPQNHRILWKTQAASRGQPRNPQRLALNGPRARFTGSYGGGMGARHAGRATRGNLGPIGPRRCSGPGQPTRLISRRCRFSDFGIPASLPSPEVRARRA